MYKREIELYLIPPRGIDPRKWELLPVLAHGMAQHGIRVQLSGDVSRRSAASDALLLSMRLDRYVRSEARRLQVPRPRRALLILEPPVTSRVLHSRSAHQFFALRLSPSPLWRGKLGTQRIRWPQETTGLARSNTEYAFHATLIASFKYSSHKGSKYWLRRSFVRRADKEGLSIAVVGQGWNASTIERLASASRSMVREMLRPRDVALKPTVSSLLVTPRNQFGWIESRAHAYGLAPLSVVIENSSDYVSEKLFDAIRFGAVPIYVGPPLSQFDLPPNIAFETHGAPGELVERIRTAMASDLSEVRAAGEAWLASDLARIHERTSVISDIARRLRWLALGAEPDTSAGHFGW